MAGEKLRKVRSLITELSPTDRLHPRQNQRPDSHDTANSEVESTMSTGPEAGREGAKTFLSRLFAFLVCRSIVVSTFNLLIPRSP